MAKKKVAKRKSAAPARKEKHDFLTWSIMGKKFHPGISLVGGAAATPVGGIVAVVGGVIAVASAVAIGAHYLKKSKKK